MRKGLLGVLALVGRPVSVSAHHVVSEYGIARVEPATVAELDFQAAAFDLRDRAGTWQLVAPSVEYSPVSRLSLTARVPVARIAYDFGDVVHGLGDVGAAAKVGIFSMGSGFQLALGLGVELPTGNEGDGLGSGHVEGSPFVAASLAPLDGLVLFGLLGDRFGIGGGGGGGAEHVHPDGYAHTHEEGVHGSVLAPHGDHELFARLWAAYRIGATYFSAGSDVAIPWQGADAVLATRTELGVLPWEDVRISVGLDFPLVGEERFSWRGRLGIAKRF